MKMRRKAVGFVSAIVVMSVSTACGSESDATDGTANGAELQIAFGNMTTGNVSFPAIEQAAEVAVKYLNEEKGGIAGQKVELVPCDVKNEDAAAQACGQELANDEDVPFGLMTMTNNGSPYWNSVKGSGKPVILGLGLTPVDDNVPDVFSYLASTNGTFRGYADYVIDNGYKSVAYIHHDDASMVAAHGIFMDQVESSGAEIDVKTTVLPASAADNLAQISSSGANEADIVFIQTAGKCPQIAQDFQSLGWKPAKVLTGSACLPIPALEETPELFEGWTILGPIKVPAAGRDSDEELAVFLDAWDEYSGTGEAPGVYAQLGWSVVMNAAAALEQADVTEITPETAREAFASFTGPSVLGPREVECPGPAEAPVGCASDLVAYDVADGKLTPAE
jgi:branched-chain amino acid transport system substrate-binding protein